jgi:hypothetical protein
MGIYKAKSGNLLEVYRREEGGVLIRTSHPAIDFHYTLVLNPIQLRQLIEELQSYVGEHGRVCEQCGNVCCATRIDSGSWEINKCDLGDHDPNCNNCNCGAPWKEVPVGTIVPARV